jgi:Tfp pilus assembly protein PilO
MKVTRNLLFVTVSFTIAGMVFLLLVVHPIFQGVLRDHEEILAQKQRSAQIQEDQKHLRDFESVFASNQSEFAQLERLFLDTQAPSGFFRFLDTTSAAFSLEVEANPGARQQEKGDSGPSIKIEIQGNGSYPNIVAFLEKIENAPYLVEIEDISITSAKASAQRGQPAIGENVLSMTLKVYTK